MVPVRRRGVCPESGRVRNAVIHKDLGAPAHLFLG